ncbi:MAG: radical SAM protein, partial [Clostridiales bacterium]|nr:radical SAM protein [Clostridiales bacterium]
SKDEIFDILAQLDECGVHRIEITGGEPMLHPAFMDIMREIAARHFHLSELITTAHYLKPEALDEFQRLGLDPMFKVSYDGVGFHDEFRGVPGAEERVVSNIRLLASRGFRAYVHTNVNEWNRGVLLETILKNARLGASYTKVLRTFEVARPAGHKLPVLDMEAYFDLALDTLEAYIQTGETMPLQLWHFASAHPASKRYTLPFAVEHDKYRDSLPLCRVIRGAVQIDYEGNLWPCMYMSGECKKRGVSFGNIREKRIAGILRDSDYLNVTCRTAGELKMANAKCAACRFWRVCAGGCRSFAMLYSDTDYLAHDPTKCLFFNKYLGKTASMFAKHGYECGNDLSFLDLKEEN